MTIITAVSFPQHLLADDPLDELVEGPSVNVIQIIDGDTVVIDPALNGATEIRLVGIQAPKLPLGRDGFVAWPLGEESKQALSDMIMGQKISLYFGNTRKDRHGRILAHLKTEDDTWVQGQMLRLGMARVYTFPDNRQLALLC